MIIKDFLQQTLTHLLAHKLRSFLAMISIFWGTVAVILLIALGNGFYGAAQKGLKKIADGQVIVRPHMTSKAYAGNPSGQVIHISVRDALEFPVVLNNAKAMTFMLGERHNRQTISHASQQLSARIIGTNASYATISHQPIRADGRFFNHYDVKQRLAVIVLSSQLAKQLFPQDSAVGQHVEIQKIPFRVIGVETAQSGGMQFNWGHGHAYIPYTSYQKLFGDADISQFIFQSKTPLTTDLLKQQVIQYLAKRYHFDPSDSKALIIPNLGHVLHFFQWFFSSIKNFLLLAGMLTLSVGAIGVANMMFLIVSERKQEIGLQMALGASDSMIMLPILLEALLVTACGGLGGLISALLSLYLLQALGLPSWLGQPYIGWGTLSLTVFSLILLGLIAGYFPAKRAAQLTPTQALAF
jgi:putative ABC transport system permease protein